MEITFFPDRGSNPGRLRDRLTLYRVAIKAGLYRKAVQVYHIPIPGDTHVKQSKWAKYEMCSVQLTLQNVCYLHVHMHKVVSTFINLA